MGFRQKKKQAELAVFGDSLINEFQAAQSGVSAVATAKYYAEQTEQAALANIASVDTGGRMYISSDAIPAEMHEPIAKASIDAHMKKVQAEQIENYSEQQISIQNEAALKTYVGKKITVVVTESDQSPVETYWLDDQSGQVYPSSGNRKIVKGTISSIDLGKNLIVVKPSFGAKLLNKALQYYVVYVINPETLGAMVRIAIH